MSVPSVKEAWKYGDEGQAFDVREGDVWQLGNHTFVCSDVMTSTLLDNVIKRSTPRMLYCDPPWGQALLNGFRTKAGKEKAEYRWEALYRRIASLAHRYSVPLFMEGSVIGSRDGGKIPATLANDSYSHHAYWQVVYYRKHPSGLFYAGNAPLPSNFPDLTGVDDDYTPYLAMRAYTAHTSHVVVDPCAGRGQTARMAEKAGWSSVNNELHPARLSAALHRFQGKLGEPVRVMRGAS